MDRKMLAVLSSAFIIFNELAALCQRWTLLTPLNYFSWTDNRGIGLNGNLRLKICLCQGESWRSRGEACRVQPASTTWAYSLSFICRSSCGKAHLIL